MNAMLVHDDRLVWSPVPKPEPGPNQVLVKVRCAGVNRADLLQRQGRYPSPEGCPPWMGLEISGEIEAVGQDVSDWMPGDQVCALLGGGGYGEYVTVRHDMLLPIPKGLSLAQAAALPEAFATSYLNLFLEGKFHPGQTVLITGGNSGLATAAIPLAKAFGARVLTSVRSQEAAEQIAYLGADQIVVTASTPLSEVLAQEAVPVCVVMDCLGGQLLEQCLPHMARGGYWVLISTLAGTESTIALRPLLTKGLHLVGSMLRNRSPEVKAEILRQLKQTVWPKLESGQIPIAMPTVLPMLQAEDAHAQLLQRGHQGKLVLQLP